jgi:HEPN domain-containing protein
VHPDPSDEARVWFAQAAEDLSAARHLATNPDMPARLAAFLAHLAAEKALKAALIARGVTAFSRYHGTQRHSRRSSRLRQSMNG